MKRIIEGAPVAEFVSNRLGVKIVPPYGALGVEENGKILGGVIFNNWSGADVDVSVAGMPRAWTRAFLKRLAHYAWVELGVLRVTFLTEQESVVTLAKRLGAKIEGIKRNSFGAGRNGTLLGLLKEDWKI
jgi:hypothetical protein